LGKTQQRDETLIGFLEMLICQPSTLFSSSRFIKRSKRQKASIGSLKKYFSEQF